MWVLLQSYQIYSHNARANNSKRLEIKKSVIIPGDSITKLLNGREMTKRIQSKCKIYLKTFPKQRFHVWRII